MSFPVIKKMLEMTANTKTPNIAKSLISAPIDLPLGPPVAYPIEYINLPINIARPNEAAGIEK